MPLEQAVLDFQSLGLGLTASRASAPRRPRRRPSRHGGALVAAARGAGLRAEGIDLSAFAMIRALGPARRAGRRAAALGTLYVNVAGMTNLAIANGAACHFTRVAAVGVTSMAAELAERAG